ncbi:MAG TPA: UvrD-helicase domain-containing protein [Ignavibacteriaceae bacterium]|jgi:DNA helicase-2/ATP-dependent DNA helicase PcrA|nr:UvrD-helicase domain-containing protein [Ignavibacteriaceae bacterium]HOJ18624.1 UvrD-helicase domain-containing protein [Ignavibacteriaceae bacterium]HPO55243.1 UvrD-helicase domain-containing protein [Ignavibacteriaceae bacterium]
MLNLKSLNPQQRKAIEYDEGPALIIAGAGSGKTRVLTYKVAYLVEQGYEPDSILALTFTRKAALEMKERTKKLIGSKADQIWMGTFHSVFSRFLRSEAAHINYEPNFSIYDTEDSHSLVSNVLESLKLSPDNYNPGSIRHRISYLKNHMISPEKFKKNYISTFPEQKVFEVYVEYQKRLRENNSMDFDDLLLKPIELFSNNPKILTKYRKKFSYILVDEFQDTNKAQYELLKLMSPKDGKITAVGDDAQSIYSWRGADITNILNFEKDFSKCKVFRLEQNYRSTKSILAVADCVIKNNKDQIQKTLWTDNPQGEAVTLIKCSDEKDEAYQISRVIKNEITTNKRQLKDFAILYRTNSQSRALEDVFRREKIAYAIIGGLEFYKRKEIKDLVAYLKVINNNIDEESLLRIMNFPQRGIGVTTIQRMIVFARKHEITLFETMSRVFEVIDIKERIQKNVKNFKVLLDKYMILKDELSVGEMTRALVDELGIISLFKDEKSVEGRQKIENVQELLSSIMQFSNQNPKAALGDYLQEVSLMTDTDSNNAERNFVSLQTVHSAKGLEYPVVFLSGCEEDIFPLSNKFSTDATVQEERRLFYVALTRAMEKAYLSHARSRYRFGEVAYQNRSRFIDEISPDLCCELNGGLGKKANRKSKKEIYYEYFENMDYVDFNQENIDLKVGVRVMHDKFGLGKVIHVVGAGEAQRVTVSFEGNNVKQLMIKYAKLKVLS